MEATRALLEPAPPQLSLRRQCALLGVARSGVYDQPVGDRAEDLQLMRLLDAPYTETPFDGVRRMTAWLRRQGDAVHPKHIRRLLRQMGLEAIYPKPRLSQPAAGHTIDPSLLRGVTSGRVNQVWSAAITSIRLAAGCGVPGGGDRLVQPVCGVLGGVDHDGCGVWCGGLGAGTPARPAGDLQDGSRGAVDESWPSPSGCSKAGCGSVWMAAAGPSITCVWSGCGAV